MKKWLLILHIVSVISLSFSLNIDYGASIDSFVGGNLSETSYLFGFEKVSLYSSIQLGESVNFAVDGFYKFSYNSSLSENTHIFDLTTLLFSIPIGSRSLKVGRNVLRDYSGDILSHTLDGISLTLPLGSSVLIGNAGYSGLVNSNEVSLLSTFQDESNVPRIVEGVDLIKEGDAFTLWASLYSLQDVNNLSSNLPLYLGGGVSGAIGSSIYYSLRGNYQTGLFPYVNSITQERTRSIISAGMGALTINWYISGESELVNYLSPYLTVNLGISSGDSDLQNSNLGIAQEEITGAVTLYAPMTAGGPGVIYSVNNQNLTYLKMLASASPMKDLQAQLGTTIFFRTVAGITSDSSVVSNDSGNYMGSEISLTANYRPFSDLGVSVSSGIFFPNDTVLEGGISGMVTAYLSLSL